MIHPPVRVSPLMARQYAHLRAMHQHVALSIHAAFADARRHVSPALARFQAAYAEELARAQRADEDEDNERAHVSLLWLHSASGALRTLRPAVLSGVQYAATRAQQATQNGQQQGVTDGQIAAGLLIADLLRDDPLGGASGYRIAARPAVSPLGLVGYSAWDRQPLANRFNALAPNAWEAVQTAAHSGVANGVTPSALFAALFAAALTSPEQRAQLVGEQETTNAYRAGVSATFSANAAVVGGWMWVAQPDACDECAAQHGTIHDASETLDSHPRCRCQQQPLSNPEPFV